MIPDIFQESLEAWLQMKVPPHFSGRNIRKCPKSPSTHQTCECHSLRVVENRRVVAIPTRETLGEFSMRMLRKQMKRQFRAIRPLSLHCPSTILSKLEPVAGLELLACPSGSSGQLRRLRKLHQFALNSCDNTGSWEDFQPFVQRTSTVCPVHSQRNDFQIWCPFWCPLLNRK